MNCNYSGKEPRHFHTSHGEVEVKANRTALPTICRGYSPDHGRGVQHLVTVGEGVARNILDSSISQLLPGEYALRFAATFVAALPSQE
ncbi:hypothetical protein TIFTF001_002605 [Ficus carica]|uniref:Uncharacterized protein n=1 Tax=Ficus carica TaxID=3494 RepID=A0AA87Z5P7_FICCA|nr:hypothetical protein TIFTF001_002605 [Ficus carica]